MVFLRASCGGSDTPLPVSLLGKGLYLIAGQEQECQRYSGAEVHYPASNTAHGSPRHGIQTRGQWDVWTCQELSCSALQLLQLLCRAVA